MRIALLEDNPDQSRQIHTWLTTAGFHVQSFELGHSFQEATQQESFDLYLLDWMVPDIHGPELLTWLRQTRKDNTPVIFLTVCGEEDDIVAMLKGGADDFLTKPVSQGMLHARVNAVTRRQHGHANTLLLQAAPYEIDLRAQTIHLRDKLIPLTPREYGLAVHLFRNIGSHLSRKALLEAVWGFNPDVLTRTVDTHVSRVRAKLQICPENGFCITSSYNIGYRLNRISQEGLEGEGSNGTARGATQDRED